MAISIEQIFAQKFQNIQSRLPIKMNSHNDINYTFEEALNSTIINSSNTQNTTRTTTNNINEYSSQIEDSISKASSKYGVNANLIKSIVKAESAFNPFATSKAGAEGLMQLMPSTANGLGVLNSFDINQNIDGGTKYFKDKLDQFNGDTKLALAAYNAGPNAVIKYNGIPPFEETKNYVAKVLNYYDEYNNNR